MPRLDPTRLRLRCRPWKVQQVFAPIEAAIAHIEHDGTVETVDGTTVINLAGDRVDLPQSIIGIVEFFELAGQRIGVPVHLEGLVAIAVKLDTDQPLVLEDLANARSCIAHLKHIALNHLTVGEAESALSTLKIRWAVEDIATGAHA